MEWKPVKTAPIAKRVLLLWDTLNHIEDGTVYKNEYAPCAIYAVLFDGESLNVQPTHWMPLPEPPRK